MDNTQAVQEFDTNLEKIIICICVISAVLLIMQILELIRFYRYGKISPDLKLNSNECKWQHISKTKNGIVIPCCTNPRIFKKNIKCSGPCNKMRHKDLPPYPKSLMWLITEALLALINFIIIIAGFAFEII